MKSSDRITEKTEKNRKKKLEGKKRRENKVYYYFFVQCLRIRKWTRRRKMRKKIRER